MQTSLARKTETLEQRLVFFFYDAPRAGYMILDHDDQESLNFSGDVQVAAKAAMEKSLLWLAGHCFHLYRPFTLNGIEYHPVLLEFGDAYARDTAVLHRKGFDFVPLMDHPLGSYIRRAPHLIPVRF